MASLLEQLRDTDTIYVETRKADGDPHRTPIWSVTSDGAGYIRSAHGAGAAWYRRAMSGGLAIVTSQGPVPVRLSLVGDEATRDAVDRAYRSKYADQAQFLPPLLSTDARATTMRVEPA